MSIPDKEPKITVRLFNLIGYLANLKERYRNIPLFSKGPMDFFAHLDLNKIRLETFYVETRKLLTGKYLVNMVPAASFQPEPNGQRYYCCPDAVQLLVLPKYQPPKETDRVYFISDLLKILRKYCREVGNLPIVYRNFEGEVLPLLRRHILPIKIFREIIPTKPKKIVLYRTNKSIRNHHRSTFSPSVSVLAFPCVKGVSWLKSYQAK